MIKYLKNDWDNLSIEVSENITLTQFLEIAIKDFHKRLVNCSDRDKWNNYYLYWDDGSSIHTEYLTQLSYLSHRNVFIVYHSSGNKASDYYSVDLILNDFDDMILPIVINTLSSYYYGAYNRNHIGLRMNTLTNQIDLEFCE